MSHLRFFTMWLVLAFAVGGVVGLALIDPGGTPSTGAREFGRAVLAPVILGGAVAILLSSPVAVTVAVLRDLWQRRHAHGQIHHSPCPRK
jgi:O-antigen ligase